MGGGEREERQREMEPFVFDWIEEMEDGGRREVMVAVGRAEGQERERGSGGKEMGEGRGGKGRVEDLGNGTADDDLPD